MTIDEELAYYKAGKSRKLAHRDKYINYLADPDNPVVSRNEMARRVLGVSPGTLWGHFDSHELAEMERIALMRRRAAYARRMAKVDDGLLRRAESGDPAAAKLAYQRFEGWTERTMDIDLVLDLLAEIIWRLLEEIPDADRAKIDRDIRDLHPALAALPAAGEDQ